MHSFPSGEGAGKLFTMSNSTPPRPSPSQGEGEINACLPFARGGSVLLGTLTMPRRVDGQDFVAVFALREGSCFQTAGVQQFRQDWCVAVRGEYDQGMT